MINKKSLNDQIINLILSKIRSGEVKPGGRLESQDELAQNLGVSRATVREALSKLESMGIIEVIHGNGTFVKDVQDYSYMDDIAGLLMVLDLESVIQVLEVRKLIENYTVQMAAEKATDEDIAILENIQESLGKNRNDPAEYDRLDKNFHLQIAMISKNIVLSRLLSIVLKSYHEELSTSAILPNALTVSEATVTEIITSIKRKDRQGAAAGMAKHIDAVIVSTREQLVEA